MRAHIRAVHPLVGREEQESTQDMLPTRLDVADHNPCNSINDLDIDNPVSDGSTLPHI